MIQFENYSSELVKAKVDLFNGATLVASCTCGEGEGLGAGSLSDFTLSREGDNSKFFGFGICHKMDINLIDNDRLLALEKGFVAEVCLGDGEYFNCPFPTLYLTEIKRDQKTNEITATAHDVIYKAVDHDVSELTLGTEYSIRDLAQAIATFLGVTLTIINVDDNSFDTYYDMGANLDGSEKLRSMLDAIAEATQTIYYINYQDSLVFKRLERTGIPVLTIDRENYYELNTQTARTITGVCSATELGNNIEAVSGDEGITQYIRDNPLWELRDDLATLVDNALIAVNGLTIHQFECDWFGDYQIEIGDKIEMELEDGSTITSYFLSDVIEYAGTLSQVTEWEYTEGGGDSLNNPTTLGEAINQTTSRVDKINKQIQLVVSKSDEASQLVSELKVTTDAIEATVNSTVAIVNEHTEEIEQLKKDVSLTISEDDVQIIVEKTLEDGVSSVKTAKEFTFDENGLDITSPNSDISTTITEDGMSIKRYDAEVLKADNEGVKAEDLHATTYLIIGLNSRLEDWARDGKPRTACFWIGEEEGDV